jgi:hypothetical protein
MSARARSRRLGLLAALAALGVLGLSPVFGGTAQAVNNPVKTIVITGVSSNSVDVPPAGTAGSRPNILVAVLDTVTVSVSFKDALGAPASFGKDTELVLSTTGGDAGNTKTVGATDTSTTINSSAFSKAANNVKVTVSAPSLKGKFLVTAGTSDAFDVLATLDTFAASPGTSFVRDVGKDGGAACGEVNATNPICATVILPEGAGPDGTAPIVIGTGTCDDSTYSDCSALGTSTQPASYVVELLADLSRYSSTSPATVILTCDKAFCGKGSISRNVPHFAIGGNVSLADVPPCAAKGVAPAPGSVPGACVDYVQSNRDNAGDTHLWVLFAVDARMSCC